MGLTYLTDITKIFQRKHRQYQALQRSLMLNLLAQQMHIALLFILELLMTLSIFGQQSFEGHGPN